MGSDLTVDESGAALRRVARDRGSVHGRTLYGAIDTHLGRMAHLRPYLLSLREDALERMAAAWIGAGGANWLPALDEDWFSNYLAELTESEREVARAAIADLRAWAACEGLLAAEPTAA